MTWVTTGSETLALKTMKSRCCTFPLILAARASALSLCARLQASHSTVLLDWSSLHLAATASRLLGSRTVRTRHGAQARAYAYPCYGGTNSTTCPITQSVNSCESLIFAGSIAGVPSVCWVAVKLGGGEAELVFRHCKLPFC